MENPVNLVRDLEELKEKIKESLYAHFGDAGVSG